MNDRPNKNLMASDETGLHPYVLEATGISKAFVQGGLNVQVLNNTQLSVRRGEKLAIVGVTLVLTYIATLFPARGAANTDPVQVLRYE
jgi:ABC-type lipoprotein release transport system permease subunit